MAWNLPRSFSAGEIDAVSTYCDSLPAVASAVCDQLKEVSDHLHEYSIELTGLRKPGKYRVDVKLMRGRPTYLHSVMLEVKLRARRS